ncbi:helix-turn-helix domain-containing protein [Streptomyces paludis]|uniref:Helix-turn-helix domain-containing protein n=1 Tax=Streptomyces paludis TaxID=2282738 RepID=A0A345HLQ1_9ACTN|nr:helix-turn-helix domain-containing protein [Streptomyces paludis]AXG77625.1 helix-turn-helix domain-containing protein [Streptomyces paludis]
MPDLTDIHIGARVASRRKLAGYTQRQLAEHAHLSLGIIRKVERGERPPTPSFLAGAARALHVTVEDLTGQPYRLHPQDDRIHAPITDVRAALRHWDLPGDWFEAPRPLAELRADVQTAMDHRVHGRLTRLGEVLPALIEELTASVHLRSGADKRRAARLLSLAYDMAHTFTYRLGYPDLRGQVEDRLRWSAQLSGDPLLMALAEYKRAETFKSAHEYGAGLRVLRAARERLEDETPSKGSEYLTVLGGIRLREITLASRDRDSDATAHHMDAARQVLDRMPARADRRQHSMVFGAGNLAIHEIQARLELRQVSEADKVIEATSLPGSVPPTRVSAFHINVARVHVEADRREQALLHLQKARRAAPQITRYKPMARDAALLLTMKYRRTTEELRSLSSWFGLE